MSHPYANDPLRPRVEIAVQQILETSRCVAPIEVLVGVGRLRREDEKRWRAGQIPYLEHVIQGSLPSSARLLRILRWHAHDRNLVPRVVRYQRRSHALRFTKTNDSKLEEAYARHFEWPGESMPPRWVRNDSGFLVPAQAVEGGGASVDS